MGGEALITQTLPSPDQPTLEYDFIQEMIVDSHDQYVAIAEKFKNIRNRAYFNLGKILKENGETLRSFLYFKDAFRLSIFDCGKVIQPESCMRWKAEQEIKELISIADLDSYINWRKR